MLLLASPEGSAACAATMIVLASRALSMAAARRDARVVLHRIPGASNGNGTRSVPHAPNDSRPTWPAGFRLASAFTRAGRLVGAPARRRRSEQHLVEWIDGATRIVRSGGSLRQALVAGIGALSAPGDEFVRLRDDLVGGAPLDDALARFETTHPSSSALLAARSISLAGETGGRPARLLEGVGFTVRERLECGREARALATQARSSAVVIMAAPVVFAMVAVGVDRRVGAFLLGSVGGLLCVTVGLGLEAVGCAWMARLVRRTE